MIEIYAVNCKKGLNKIQFEELSSAVGKDKQARIKCYRKHEDALRTLLADILVRVVVSGKLNLPPCDVGFSYNNYGKPYLKDYEGLHFNTTHSEDWVACAIDNRQLGIDIELVKTLDLGIAESFFSTEENNMLKSKANTEKLEYFYDLWTLKESYIKALGKGLTIPLDSFTALKHKGCITLKSTFDSNTYYFKQYDIDSSYKLSVCGLNSTFGDITVYDCNQLYNYFKSKNRCKA